MDLLKDDVRKLFYAYLIPAISSAIAVAIYSLVDTIVIGQGVGPDGMAACAIVLPIFSIASFIATLCGIGGSVLMTRARGSGHPEKGDAYFTAAIILVMVLTLSAWIPGYLLQEPFYRLCGADEVLMPYSKDYGTWIFAFLPSFVITSFLGAFIRSDGAPRVVMCSTLTGGVVNMFGDWLFVFPLNMGMTGAAIATVLGSVVQAVLLLGYILLKKTSLHVARPHHWIRAFRNIIITGFGAGINSLAVIAVSFIANNQIMNYAGSASLAVYGALGTVAALFTCVFSGIGQAVQPVSSANYGAGTPERSWMAGKLGLKNALLFGTLFTVISVAFPLEVAGLFMKMTPEVEEVTPYIMRVFSLSYIPQAGCIFSIYFLQSIVHPKMATILSLLRGIILNGSFLILFPLLWGANGIWWALFSAELLTTLAAGVCIVTLYRKHPNIKS